jgi:hypothetical protein
MTASSHIFSLIVCFGVSEPDGADGELLLAIGCFPTNNAYELIANSEHSMSLKDVAERGGVSIRFTVFGSRLNIDEAIDEQSRRSIAFRLHLHPDEDVRLLDNCTLKDVHWSMYLREAIEPSKEVEALGTLSHFDAMSDDYDSEPENCHVDAALKPDNFALLLSAMQTGRVPNSVNITVRGLEYGPDPKGRIKVWDVTAMRCAPVIKLSFGIPLTVHGLEESSDAEELETADNLPASKADIRSLQQELSQQFALLGRSARKTFIGVVAAAFLMWIFRS